MDLPFALTATQEYVLIVVGILLFVFLISRFETRRYYIVRHGQSVLNREGVKQGAEGKLTEDGRRQAHLAGAYLSQFNIQRIYASPYERTQETASVVNEYVHAGRIRLTPLLAERKNPSEIVGKRKDDPDVKNIVDMVELRFHEDEFRYSDEENFNDLVARAGKCLRFLESRSGQSFCVVTHHVFLKVLLSRMMHPSGLHETDYLKFAFFNQADNGGITVCEYRRWKRWFSPMRGWDIVDYNVQLEEPERFYNPLLEARPPAAQKTNAPRADAPTIEVPARVIASSV